jgi:hypothetical protein
MAKFKIVENKRTYRFNVKVKKHWFSFWKYIRRHNDNAIAEWDTKRGAQAYINLQSFRK